MKTRARYKGHTITFTDNLYHVLGHTYSELKLATAAIDQAMNKPIGKEHV